MFKLENYITPILLSYVDKYIKNFRLEDSQVSIWGGDASFHNLDLRLEVLEQEIQLPFSFVSGHVHELLIHVPWTKLASEPITITINTIECILKLKDLDESRNADLSGQARDKQRKVTYRREEIEAPPSYVQSLVNKIVSNIKIYCNNLILKYVEEDIVVSMNVKLLTFESANDKWEPAYINISSPQALLRKLITVSDLTICLDKRNAAGKIDVYQEPILYRCSLIMRMFQQYHSVSAKRISTTRLDIYCSSMEFSMTEQQVPMIIRIGMLLFALQQRQLKPEVNLNTETGRTSPVLTDIVETNESWTGWAWSFVPFIFPTSWKEEWNEENQVLPPGHTVHIGFYVDYASVTFKVSEMSSERGAYYSQRKIKYLPLLTLRLQGIFVETISHEIKWFHSLAGISQAVILPVGQCACGNLEILEGMLPTEYLKAGIISMVHKSDSLFDAEAVENKGMNRSYNTSWDYHTSTINERFLLERTPAFALDYLYQMEVPDDVSSERLSELGSDFEYSDFHERSLLRFVVGPSRVCLCSGFFHRLSSFKVAASAYDYPPYSTPKPDPLLSELPPPCAEDFDALQENIPYRNIHITVIAPVIELQHLDHPYFEATKRNLYVKHKKLSANILSPSCFNTLNKKLPKITFECQSVEAKLRNPMYIKRLVHTACQLPEVPKEMFNACYGVKRIKITGICSRLILTPKKQTTIIMPSSATYINKTIIKPHYWVNPDIPHEELLIESEGITISGTKAKLMVVGYILDSLISMDGQDSANIILGNTLIRDATRTLGMAYLEVCLEGLHFRKVTTISTTTIDASLGSVKAFIYEPILLRDDDSSTNIVSDYSTYPKFHSAFLYSPTDLQQVLFISGPEFKDEKPKTDEADGLELSDIPPLFSATIQFPLNPENQPHPPIFVFNIQETKICIDPLLCKWLLYSPRNLSKNTEFTDPQQRKNYYISEAGGSVLETPRKVGTPHESIHSSSDREHIYIPIPSSKLAKDTETIDVQEKTYNFLIKYLNVWKSVMLNGEISQCTIYFPVDSLSAVGSRGIQEAVDEALRKEDPPEIFVVALPFVNIYNAAQRQGLSKYMMDLPIKLPSSIWTSQKSSFPWLISITDFSCCTLQSGKKLNFLEPLSLNATIGVSTQLSANTRQPKKENGTKSATDLASSKLINSPDPSINAENESTFFYKSGMGPLGICIHADVNSINITLSEVQICLIASILYGLTEVMSAIIPKRSKEPPRSPDIMQNVLGRSSTVSPTVLRDSTLDSISEQVPPITSATANLEKESGVKLTAWIQWTIDRFKLQLLSHDIIENASEDMLYRYRPNLKLVINAEDIVSSVDFRSIYLKIKSKIAMANIEHFQRKRNDKSWQTGLFLGLIMRTKDDVSTRDRQKDIGFVTLTLTRASCQHTHALWGGVQKHKFGDPKTSSSNIQLQTLARYITEIVITSQPIDFIISCSVLRSFYMIFEPMVDLSNLNKAVDMQETQDSNWLLQYNNCNLPLIFIECQGIRVIIPSAELGGTDAGQDVCMFQVDSVKLMPDVVNPICRTPCRPDIYQLAAKARILNIPSSEVEDRQYQLDITGLCVNTSTWQELHPILNHHGSTFSTLRTMSENPAVEWNNLEKEPFNTYSLDSHLHVWPVLSRFDLSIVIAPAMVYKSNTLVCGHSVEVNFVSDVNMTISLSQIKLAFALFNEFLHIFDPFVLDPKVTKRPKLIFPYLRFDSNQFDRDEEELENTADITVGDSGIETLEQQSMVFIKTRSTNDSTDTYKPLIKSVANSEKSFGIYSKPSNLLPSTQCNIPVDILITSGKISLSLYQLNKVHGKSKFKQKDKKQKPILKDNDNEGYEASEEGSIIDEKHTTLTGINRFEPLLFISVSQPNAFLSRFHLGHKIQLSCFDVSMKISGLEYLPLKTIPTEEDFPIDMIETKPGVPHPDTGISPAFLTLKWGIEIGKPATVDIDIARPTRILCSVTRWNHLLMIQQKVQDCLRRVCGDRDDKPLLLPDTCLDLNLDTRPMVKSPKTYTKFTEMKSKLHGVSNLSVKLAQIVLVVKTDNVPEVNLSISRLKNDLVLLNRPERFTNMITLESLTVGTMKDGITRLLLNPWTISVEISLLWESWQLPQSDPQIQVSIASDCIMLDISQEQINYFEVVIKDLTDFFASIKGYENISSEIEPVHDLKLHLLDKDQYYKDDLRAGAFQFFDATTQNVDELPLPYQVMFWNKTIAAMAWRYPEPRALMKVRIFPVPFKTTSDNYNQPNCQILCHLEYWSDCHGCYRPYVQFYLSESEVHHLELPKNNTQFVACIWRVVLSSQTGNSQSYSFDRSRVLISPRALAACMRIDSYFNKALVPDLTLALEISRININMYNNFNKNLPFIMPEALQNYTCDSCLPANQCFLTLTLDGIRAYLGTWNFETVACDITTTTQCSALDYRFLTQQTLLEPFSSKLEINLTKNMSVDFISKPIHLRLSTSIAHTLTVSLQMWEQSLKMKNNTHEMVKLAIMTHYVMCNDTNVNLRFGQSSTDEDILLRPRECHFYAWRSQKSKQTLRVGLEENGWVWSRLILIDIEGTVVHYVGSTHNVMIIVTVKNLSTTQKQVIFSGQLIICNMVSEHFELKVVPVGNDDRDKEFKKAHSHIIPEKSTPPSLLIDMQKQYHLRLRFFGLESAWSGDIPLKKNIKCAQPWLVKVPLQERGQFLSIWCRIVTQEHVNGIETLVILWPLFMIRSNLPVSAKVDIETPTLNVHLESTVHGKGEYQQLYCPGTIDHSHQLYFQFDGGNPTSNPYVPVNYSLVDQKQFFKRSDKENINEILQALNSFNKHVWPYFGEDFEGIDWVCEDQPLTHVQVRYQNACCYSSALLVELLPWSLLINILGCPIAIIVNKKELCRINHHGIISPPKLEETFHIAIGINNTWSISLPLQLAKSEWSQVFYMPKITGTIPIDGTIQTAINCDKHICMISITSLLVNEIRLLKISSSHVLTNHTQMQMEIACLAVADTDEAYKFPRNMERNSFTIAPNLHKSNAGVSIIQWYYVGNGIDLNSDFALYISVSIDTKFGWSCPVRVDKSFTRRNISVQTESQSIPIVIIGQEYKGQTYLSIHNDIHPQILIHNSSGIRLFFGQAANEDNMVVNDCQHFKWMCSIDNENSSYYTMSGYSEKFPDISQTNFVENIVIASDPQGDQRSFQWSTPIDITNCNNQFLHIPYFGDVKVTVVTSVYTAFLSIESATQVEISARDIRIRLFMHEHGEQNVASVKPGLKEIQEEFIQAADSAKSNSTTSDTTITSSYFSADDTTSMSQSMSDTSISTAKTAVQRNNYPFNTLYGFKMHPTVEELSSVMEFNSTMSTSKSAMYAKAISEVNICGSSLATTMPMKKDWTSLQITVFLKGVTITLISDSNSGCLESNEVMNISCDDIVLTMMQAEMMQLTLSILELQCDNQLCVHGGFDFPVILIGKEPQQKQELTSLNTPINHWIANARKNPLIRIDINVESWNTAASLQRITGINDIKISIQPISAFIEDAYITRLIEYLPFFVPTKLVLWPKQTRKPNYSLNSMLVGIPEYVMWESAVLAQPLTLQCLTIEPTALLLSVHSSIKLYIALDQSPLQFGKFERKRLVTTSFRLGHALTMHYLSGAIFGAGWMVGSLELLGAPGGLARAMGTGLRDFVSMPYRGLVQGPMAFLRGMTNGSASLMKHITAGTVQSVTKMASSVARNLDRLTLDEEHLKRTEKQRRQRPQGLTQGFLQGLTGLGISLLGAVGGIAHHPIQSIMSDGASPKGLAAGVGLGLVGVLTKPLSGAADLVALTGQGLLQGAGWNPMSEPRTKPIIHYTYSDTNSILKYNWKFMQSVTQSSLLFVTDATWITNEGQYEGVALILTTEALMIANIDEDVAQHVVTLAELHSINESTDPTLLKFKLFPSISSGKSQTECVVEMDPACRARVADYVRSTVGLLKLPDFSPDPSEMSVSPCPTPLPAAELVKEYTILTFYVNPQSRNYFLTVLALAKQQHQNYSFPVL